LHEVAKSNAPQAKINRKAFFILFIFVVNLSANIIKNLHFCLLFKNIIYICVSQKLKAMRLKQTIISHKRKFTFVDKPKYHIFIKYHLGSNRVVVNINSDVELQKAQEKQ
jgi:hypothetical protein